MCSLILDDAALFFFSSWLLLHDHQKQHDTRWTYVLNLFDISIKKFADFVLYLLLLARFCWWNPIPQTNVQIYLWPLILFSYGLFSIALFIKSEYCGFIEQRKNLLKVADKLSIYLDKLFIIFTIGFVVSESTTAKMRTFSLAVNNDNSSFILRFKFNSCNFSFLYF